MLSVKNHVHVLQGKHLHRPLPLCTHHPQTIKATPVVSFKYQCNAGRSAVLFESSINVSPSFHSVFHLACHLGLLCLGHGVRPWCFRNLFCAWERRCEYRVRLEPDECSVGVSLKGVKSGSRMQSAGQRAAGWF